MITIQVRKSFIFVVFVFVCVVNMKIYLLCILLLAIAIRAQELDTFGTGLSSQWLYPQEVKIHWMFLLSNKSFR